MNKLKFLKNIKSASVNHHNTIETKVGDIKEES